MNKLIKPSSLLFYFLSVVVFFVLGMLVAKVVGAGKNQMLAGGAIVFFYGVVSAGLALILSIFMVHNLEHNFIIKLNKILGVLFFLIVCFVGYKIVTMDKKDEPAIEYPMKTTSPVKEE